MRIALMLIVIQLFGLFSSMSSATTVVARMAAIHPGAEYEVSVAQGEDAVSEDAVAEGCHSQGEASVSDTGSKILADDAHHCCQQSVDQSCLDHCYSHSPVSLYRIPAVQEPQFSILIASPVLTYHPFTPALPLRPPIA